MNLIAFDQDDFSETFEMDLNRARGFVYLFSGFIAPRALSRLVDTFRRLTARGVRVCVFLQRPDNWDRRENLTAQELEHLNMVENQVQVLESLLIHVNLRKMVHQKIVVIDQAIVWSGSLNVLSCNPRNTLEGMTRIVDVRHATILMEKHSMHTCERCLAGGFPSEYPCLRVDSNSIGPMLEALRKSKGLSREEVARKAGIDRSVLSRIETGKRIAPSVETVAKIATCLDSELALLPAHALPFSQLYVKLSGPQTVVGVTPHHSR